MHHTEAVGDEGPAGPVGAADQFGQFGGQCLPFGVILAGLAWIEANVLQQQDVPVGQTLGTGQRIGADHVAGQLDVPAQPLRQHCRHRRQ